MTPRQINLFNPAILPKADPFSATRLMVGLGCISLFIVMATGVSLFLSSTQKDEVAVMTARVADLRTKYSAQMPVFLERQQSTQNAIAVLDANILAARKLLTTLVQQTPSQKTISGASVMHALSNISTDAIWLTKIDYVITGDALALEGITLDPSMVAPYVESLQADPDLSALVFGHVEIQAQPNARAWRFTISAQQSVGRVQ